VVAMLRPVRFALDDALDVWRIAGTLAALLFQHAPGQERRAYERFLQTVDGDLGIRNRALVDEPLEVFCAVSCTSAV
jgi:hypothetical protein